MELGGLMGHKASNHDTTEIFYAAYGPNSVAAVAAIDGFMSDVGGLPPAPSSDPNSKSV